MSKISMHKVHHITEMWSNDDHTEVQTILYQPGDTFRAKVVSGMTRLIIRTYWDKNNKVIKEEHINEY